MTFLPRRLRARAFTLIELLVVVGIMGLLMALSVPMVASVSESSNLTAAGQTLADQIRLAVQISASRNEVVEVRLVKLSRPAGSAARYRAVQLWTANASGTMVPQEKISLFPGSIAINESPQLSPLLTLPNIQSGTFAQGGASGIPYVAFRVHPSGYFEPEPAAATKSHLYVTLLPDRLVAAAAAPPNYLTVQVSPYTCAPAIYRP